MKSTYKNWRRIDTPEIPLSTKSPVLSVSEGADGGLDVTFKNDVGKRITFYLNEEDKNLLLAGLNKIFIKKPKEGYVINGGHFIEKTLKQ